MADPDKIPDGLIAALREHQARLRELLDAIEKRDLSASEVRHHVGWIADGVKRIRGLSKA